MSPRVRALRQQLGQWAEALDGFELTPGEQVILLDGPNGRTVLAATEADGHAMVGIRIYAVINAPGSKELYAYMLRANRDLRDCRLALDEDDDVVIYRFLVAEGLTQAAFEDGLQRTLAVAKRCSDEIVAGFKAGNGRFREPAA